MPPPGETASTLPKAPAQDEPDAGGEGDESLERFLDSYGNVAPNPPRNREGSGRFPPGHEGDHFPNTYTTSPEWPPNSQTSSSPPPPPPPPPSQSESISSSTTSYPPPPESDPYAFPSDRTTICITDRYGSTVYTTIVHSSSVHSPDLISESESGISYRTVTADNTGTVTDTATIVLSGEATRVVFPQHDKSTSKPPPPPPGAHGKGLRDTLLGVFLGAGLVLLFAACWFGYRAYKRKRKIRGAVRGDDQPDSEQPQQSGAPEMQATGPAVTMASMADAHIPPPLSPPPPFPNESQNPVPSESQSLHRTPEPPIIINPFSDPTYNSSSGIEDYMVSNGIRLGREPENPFLHPDDQSLNILEHRRPNSVGDFPPDYTTVDGDPTDVSGRRVREERFPFGDEALSVRAESDTGSVNGVISESIPDYQYDDPNGVADGFRYNPTAGGLTR
ncbi:hypothetical protein ABW20_dc0109784 [Dactylellina cionopaga]|nr:hypothetical protein ABW20_dc0109784 [Dactylellina cionopaga]